MKQRGITLGTSAFATALAEQTQTKGPECSISVLLGTLNDTDRDDLQAALDDPGVQHAQITRALSILGHKVASTTIGRHRRGECKNCPASA